MVTIQTAGRGDVALFDHIHDDVFDGPLDPLLLRSYLADPRLHMAVALEGAQMIGMGSGMNYHHPDKPPQMWINELGVAGPWRRQGVATQLVGALCELGRGLSCTEIWVIAEPTAMAEGFYSSLGWTREGENLALFAKSLRP